MRVARTLVGKRNVHYDLAHPCPVCQAEVSDMEPQCGQCMAWVCGGCNQWFESESRHVKNGCYGNEVGWLTP